MVVFLLPNCIRFHFFLCGGVFQRSFSWPFSQSSVCVNVTEFFFSSSDDKLATGLHWRGFVSRPVLCFVSFSLLYLVPFSSSIKQIKIEDELNCLAQDKQLELIKSSSARANQIRNAAKTKPSLTIFPSIGIIDNKKTTESIKIKPVQRKRYQSKRRQIVNAVIKQVGDLAKSLLLGNIIKIQLQ